MRWIKKWLAHPLTRGLELDDPGTTQLRRQILRENGFLRQIYQEWYLDLSNALPAGEGAVLELGSGAGFLQEFIPDIITSEIFYCSGVGAVLDGQALPFRDGSLRGIVMTDVFHHLPEPRLFLTESARCLRPGGVIAMVEPWVTAWARMIYTRLHHEPLQVDAADWSFPSSGPLSGANIALPWIIFERDRHQFEREFPQWRISAIRLQMPFRYLVSGGVSLRTRMPSITFGLWRAMENALWPWMNTWAMFALITLERRPNTF